MDYRKETESILEKHRLSLRSIENLEKRKAKLVWDGPKNNLVSNYNNANTQHTAYSKSALNDLVEVEHIRDQIYKTKEEAEHVENILKQIKEENSQYETFLRLKYIEKFNMNDCAKMLGYSENSKETIYNIKEAAISMFTLLYWGIN